MAKIWKYPAPAPGEHAHIEMPVGAQILRVDHGQIWALIPDDDELRESRLFYTKATGQDFNSNYIYVGTYFQGPFVWHVLEDV